MAVTYKDGGFESILESEELREVNLLITRALTNKTIQTIIKDGRLIQVVNHCLI